MYNCSEYCENSTKCNNWPSNIEIPKSCQNKNNLSYISNTPTKKYKRNNNANIKFNKEAIETSISHNLSLSSIEEPLPTGFNWLLNDKEIISRGEEDQGSCGCCWAFSIAMVLSDRYAIAYYIYSPKISPAYIMMCSNNQNSGYYKPNSIIKQNISNQPPSNITQCTCGGNNYISSKYYLENNGVKMESCWPYKVAIKNNNGISSPQTMSCPSDNLECLICGEDSNIFSIEKDSTRYLVYKDNNDTINYNKTINNIKQEIRAAGPVMTNFRVPYNFSDWWNTAKKNEIYIPPTNIDKFDGAHAVSLVGWGTNNGIDYWLMRNCWGLTHDGVGYCKFAITPEETDDKYKTGIDIPVVDEGGYLIGGAVRIKAGPLPLNWGTKFNPEKLITKASGNIPREFGDFNLYNIIKNNWNKFLIILIIFILIFTFFLV